MLRLVFNVHVHERVRTATANTVQAGVQTYVTLPVERRALIHTYGARDWQSGALCVGISAGLVHR